MWDTLSEEDRAEIEAGEAAIGVLRRYESYERWREIGKALLILQIAAQGNLPKPSGRTYSERYQTLGKHAPKLVDIDKAARSHAIWIEKNAAKVDQWHVELKDPKLRLKLNHPTSVFRAYQAHLKEQLPTNFEPDEKKPSPIAKERLKVSDLQTENANLKALATKAWDKLSDTEVIAQITNTKSEDNIRRIAEGLLEHVGDKKPPRKSVKVISITKRTKKTSNTAGQTETADQR